MSDNKYKLADGTTSDMYKVGDKFEVVSNEGMGSLCKVGEIIRLIWDDQTSFPLFSGDDTFYMEWSNLKSAQEEEITKEPTSTENTPRQILEQAFTEIFDKYGVVVTKVEPRWFDTRGFDISTESKVDYEVQDITITGECVR